MAPAEDVPIHLISAQPGFNQAMTDLYVDYFQAELGSHLHLNINAEIIRDQVFMHVRVKAAAEDPIITKDPAEWKKFAHAYGPTLVKTIKRLAVGKELDGDEFIESLLNHLDTTVIELLKKKL